MSLQLVSLVVAHLAMAGAAVDFTDRRPFAWPELLGASFVLAFGASL